MAPSRCCFSGPLLLLAAGSSLSASAVMRAGLWVSPPSCCTRAMEARAGSAFPSVQSCQVGGVSGRLLTAGLGDATDSVVTAISSCVAVSLACTDPSFPLCSHPPTINHTGAPIVITALPGEPGQAELTTDQGAIYVTNNRAYTWSAAVLETVDATLNRTVSSGEYLLPSRSGVRWR